MLELCKEGSIDSAIDKIDNLKWLTRKLALVGSQKCSFNKDLHAMPPSVFLCWKGQRSTLPTSLRVGYRVAMFVLEEKCVSKCTHGRLFQHSRCSWFQEQIIISLMDSLVAEGTQPIAAVPH